MRLIARRQAKKGRKEANGSWAEAMVA